VQPQHTLPVPTVANVRATADDHDTALGRDVIVDHGGIATPGSVADARLVSEEEPGRMER